MIKRNLGAIAGCVLLAIGVAACGSSKSSTTTGSTASTSAAPSKTATTPAGGSGTISGAGSTFAAPVYEQWGSSIRQPQGQLPGGRLGRRPHGDREQGRRLRRQRPAAEARRLGSDREERQPGGADPDVPGRDHRLLQPARRQERPEARRPDPRRHLHRQDQDLERRGDQGAEPGRVAAQHLDHGRAPLRLLGDDRRLHGLPLRSLARIQEQGRRRQGSAVAHGHGRQGQRRRRRARSSRRSARSATSSRPTLCRTASPTPRSRTKPASTSSRRSASTSAAGVGVKIPADLGVKVDQLAERRTPTRSPRRRSSSSTRTSARPAAPAAKKPPRAS